MGAGVVRVKGTSRALALSTDGNGRYCYLDPRRGAMLALAEAARNVACAGGVPIGATNCLNFGNPERPEIMWQFVEAVEGIAEACRALDMPITGGNVSLYNETDGRAIYPTPIIGVVGLIENAIRVLSRTLQARRRRHRAARRGLGELGGSEYLKVVHGLGPGRAADARSRPRTCADPAARRARQPTACCSRRTTARMAGSRSRCASAPSTAAAMGLDVDVPAAGRRLDAAATLFGESASRAWSRCGRRIERR